MKTQKLTLKVLVSMLLLLVIIAGCIKEEEANQAPVCFITNPTDGQEIAKGDTVIISVEATDGDGSITEVRFSVDGVEKDSSSHSPFIFNWITTNESIDLHTLQATGVDNVGDSTSDVVTVMLVDYSPIAGFSASPTSGTAPLTVKFTDQSTNNPTHYHWDFGDGDTSTLQNPYYTYNCSGTFTVALTVSNSYDSSTATEDIVVVTNQGTFTDTRDNQTYNTLIIGNQTWFAENLNYETDNSFCYDHSTTYCDTYGRLYDWQMALYACPNGWHLPSDEEWKTLEMVLGMSQSEADGIGLRGTNEGEKMKSTTGWNSNGNGTNISGFNALPGGYGGMVGSFYNRGNYGCWWSSSAYTSTYIWNRTLSYDNHQVKREYLNKAFRFSIRCLKD